MPAPVLQFDTLTKRFGDVVAVDGLTETIAEGEYFCILGPSGCGKTTLLRLIAGFEDPSGGSILLDARSLAGTPAERRPVNIVFQSYALFPHMNVFDNIAFGLQARREDRGLIRDRVNEALSLVRLQREETRLPRQLSGGQQQRVALARALVMRPRVLLLDEPLSALDRHLRLAMQEELRRIHQQTGLTFVHITHDQAEALALGDRVAVMRAGRFVQVAQPQQVYSRPADRFVAEFVGTSNVFDAVIADAQQIRIGDVVLHTSTLAPDGTASAVVSIRPEAVRVNSPHDVNAFRAVVTAVAFAGAMIEITLQRAQQRWVAHVPARAASAHYSVGCELTLSVDPDDVVVISS